MLSGVIILNMKCKKCDAPMQILETKKDSYVIWCSNKECERYCYQSDSIEYSLKEAKKIIANGER